MFAIGMAVIMGFVALTIDVGLAFREKSNLQNAADSAALAAADELATTGSQSAAISQATSYLQMYGYQSPAQTISVNIPPTSGPHAGNSSYVEVLVTTHQSAVFRGPLDSSLWNISARSVAVVGKGNPPPYNFVSLNQSSENHTLLVKLGGQLTVTSGIYVNSSSGGDAFDIFGTGGNISANAIGVHGGWETHNGDTVTVNGITCPSSGATGPGCPTINQAILADPFAGKIAIPALGSAAACATSTFVTQPYSTAQALDTNFSPPQALNANITAAATSFLLKAAASYPIVNGDTILIESEQMAVTSGGGTQTLNVTRGVNGTTAAAHAGGKAIFRVYTPTSTAITSTGTAIQNGDTIQIDSEMMAVTGGGGTKNLTVVRAVNGTTAASHADAASILQVVFTGGTQSSPNACSLPSGSSYTMQPGTYYGGVCIGLPAGTACNTTNCTTGGGAAYSALAVGSAGLSSTATTFKVSNTAIQNGDVIQIDSEQMLVTGGGGTQNPVVTRHYNGTIAATHADKTPIYKVTAGTSVTLAAGTYVMAGGGFWVCGAASLSAPNVLIYNTNDSTYSALGPIYLNTSGTVTLGPQTTGQYTGLTIFQDPALTINNSSCNTKSSDTTTWDIALLSTANGLSGLSGTIYAPQQHAEFGDSVSGTANLAVFTGCIFIDGGNSTFNFQASGLFGVGAGLVE